MRRSPDKAPWPLQGISHAHFLHRYWQRRPLLLRQAIPDFRPLLTRAELFALACEEDAESRLVQRQEDRWTLKHGPFAHRSFPALRKGDWTLLVQGANLLHDGVAAFLERFRFLPDARLDDVMISWASDGGGVGPHVDAYDVFLVQAEGQRRWRIGPVKVPTFEPGQPLKLLTNFEPDAEYLLDPGDVLYLPPGWGHDGVAVGACMTYSVGFRAPPEGELLQQLLWKLAEDLPSGQRYSDRGRVETAVAGYPAKLPQDLVIFLQTAFARLNPGSRAMEAALGELLTEPKQQVWFEAASRKPAQLRKACAAAGLRLDRRSRMLYTSRDVMINGERVAPGLARSRLLRKLADGHAITGDDWKVARPEEIQALLQWCEQGWAHPERKGELE